jgi:hypothetical protein
MIQPPNPSNRYTPSVALPREQTGANGATPPRQTQVNNLLKNHKQLRKTGEDTELILPDSPEGSALLGQQLNIHI